MELKPGWISRQLGQAEKEAETWPEWMRGRKGGRKMKHTAGPWKVNAIDIRGRIIGDASVSQGVNKYQINNHNATVATVYRPGDASLIASATELLNVAEDMEDLLCLLESGNTAETIYHQIRKKSERARAAIAKARGRE